MGDAIHTIMSLNPIYLEATATVREAMEKMYEFDIRHLPIVENQQLIGIVSSRDLDRLLLTPYDAESTDKLEARLDVPVSQVMSGDVLTVDTEADVIEAIDLMLETKVGALPVVDADDGRLRGIVSYVDVLRLFRGRLVE